MMDGWGSNGVLELLILETLADGPSYGYAITQTVLARSKGYWELKEGSLYPILHRLEQQQALASNWDEAEGRRRKYYHLTADGQKQLEAKKAQWRAFVAGVEGVLGPAGAGS